MSVFKEFQILIIEIINKSFDNIDAHSFEGLVIEMPRQENNGDLSTNAAMVLAGKLKKRPKDIAEKIKEKLLEHPEILNVEIAGAGFINFNLKLSKWQNYLAKVLVQEDCYGQENIGQGENINIEYVSCNPTGPMHIGHSRGGVYGDVLANILDYSGYKVIREFYINDAGSQLDKLAQTVFLRYKEALTQKKIKIPEGLYPGDYLIPVAKKMAKQNCDLSLEKDIEFIKKTTVDEMMKLIKHDLKDLGIYHDVFFSEKSLHDQNKITETVQELTDKKLIYKGLLPEPKGKTQKDFEPKEQLLFKSTLFEDDQDRSLQKKDGSWTYFAAEIAYFKNKIQRGFKKLIIVLGADHIGYVKRAKAICAALDSSVECSVITCQLVNYIQDKKPIKMGKRSGNFLCVRDVIDMVGKDALRFMMLTRKNDAIIDFDIDTVIEYSKDNPVFYVQYAHVRTNSVLNSAQENFNQAYKDFINKDFDFSLLSLDEEIMLIKKLAMWPKILENSVRTFAPHRIVFYLQSLAASFHFLWQLYSNGEHYRFIVENDIKLTSARLGLAKGIQIVLAIGLKLMGIKPVHKM